MKSRKKALVVGCATALAGLAAAPNAFATGACYAFNLGPTVDTVDGGSPVVLRYIPASRGSINTDTEARKFAHLKQTAFALVGKASLLFDDRCDALGVQDCQAPEDLQQVRLMTTIDGSIIVGKALTTNTPDAPGAHMGVNVQFLRRIPGVDQFAVGPLDLECTSPQTSPTPAYWLCNIRAEIDIGYFPIFQQYAIGLPVILEKVNASQTPACSVFEDGRLEVVY